MKPLGFRSRLATLTVAMLCSRIGKHVGRPEMYPHVDSLSLGLHGANTVQIRCKYGPIKQRSPLNEILLIIQDR